MPWSYDKGFKRMRSKRRQEAKECCHHHWQGSGKCPIVGFRDLEGCLSSMVAQGSNFVQLTWS